MLQHNTNTRQTLVLQLHPAIGDLSDPARMAQAKLTASPYLTLRKLACDSHEGVLAIRGQVSTFFLKQMAQTAVRDLPGVEEINNLVRVIALNTCPIAGLPAAD
jgi:hypothetical protein